MFSQSGCFFFEGVDVFFFSGVVFFFSKGFFFFEFFFFQSFLSASHFFQEFGWFKKICVFFHFLECSSGDFFHNKGFSIKNKFSFFQKFFFKFFSMGLYSTKKNGFPHCFFTKRKNPNDFFLNIFSMIFFEYCF